MKTKVWIVIWGLKDGGAETLAKDYARLIDKQAFDATIVTVYPFENTANYRRAKEAGLRIISIFKRRNVITRGVRVLFGKWYVALRLRRMVIKERPNVIHFNSPMAHYFLPIKSAISDVRLFYTCHNEVNKHFFEKEEMAVRLLIRDNGLRLVALHEDMRNELNQHFDTDDAALIKNGIDIRSFRTKKTDKWTTLQSIGISPDAFVVGHVGRFSKVKNHGFLIKVFGEILKRNDSAHLLLIGSGELQSEVEQMISRYQMKDHVTILSHRSDMPELLHAMDVVVFPSLYEGLSVTLVEAQAVGLRCVVSDSINPANFLSSNTIPVSLEADVKVWADIALDPEIKNKEYGCIEDYDMCREIHRLERLYQGCLEES